MAGEPLYTMVLLGLELDELSMNALVIPRVKKIIQEVNMKECRALLKKVLTMSTAAEIEYFVRSYMVKKFPDAFAEETP
jgi:phosphotransferase system enzyme I (PtsI)